MNTQGPLTIVDEYVDALLDDGTGPAGAKPSPAESRAGPAAAAHSPAAVAPAPAPAAESAVVQVAPAQPAPATAPVQARHPSSIPSSQRWLRVAVGTDSYALELLCVQEVVRLAPIVAMRGANRAVLGVMNLRGRIVPVFDLGLWLEAGCVQRDDDGRSRIVVVERDDELIGVLVSSVEDVVTLGRDRIEPPLAGSQRGVILGIARVGNAPTVLLDANALFQ